MLLVCDDILNLFVVATLLLPSDVASQPCGRDAQLPFRPALSGPESRPQSDSQLSIAKPEHIQLQSNLCRHPAQVRSPDKGRHGGALCA